MDIQFKKELENLRDIAKEYGDRDLKDLARLMGKYHSSEMWLQLYGASVYLQEYQEILHKKSRLKGSASFIYYFAQDRLRKHETAKVLKKVLL